jgi:methylglutaconyl-CoA hydratase
MTEGSGATRDGRGVVTYTVDEPATRNALNTQVLQDIDDTLRNLVGDPSVRAIVMTGAASTFSSGADRAELADPVLIGRTTHLLTSVLTRIDDSSVPVVCRVNGAAFGLPEVRFGLVAGPAAAACLGRIGQTAALDVLLTGRRFGSVEAERMHLLAKVVDRNELDTAVEQCIVELLLGDPDALTATRRMVRRLSGTGLAGRLPARP